MQPSRRRRIGRGQNIAAGLVLLVASVLVMAIVMSQYVAGSGSSLPSTDTQGSAFLSESAVRGDWPRLSVTYRMGNTVIRLDYEDARHWRKEILESRDDPALTGTVMEFDDSTYREHPADTIDASTGQASVYEEPVTGGIEVPERWLHPGFATVLQQKHFVASMGETTGIAVYRQVFPAVKCAVQEPGHPPIPQPAACEHGDTYREVETWTFRTDITPPMAITGRSEADGQVQWQVEVLSVERVP